jgi:chemotaxis protein methyltransferase CheR
MAALTNLDSPLTTRVDLTADNFRYLCQAIYEDSGIVLDESKGYLLEARLLPVARKESAGSLDDLCNLIRAVGGRRLRERVVEAMTINETLFFRDVRPWAALEKVLLPELLEKNRAQRKLRFWSAACSSGQEAYSLAMMLTEMNLSGWTIEIVGTDLSDSILERARAGSYMQIEVNRGLPARYLVKYFTREGMEWVIKPELRDMIRWQKCNLITPAALALGRFDIVFCRNVLIYFDVGTKKSILANIRRVLEPGGHLFLGTSETTLNLDDVF